MRPLTITLFLLLINRMLYASYQTAGLSFTQNNHTTFSNSTETSTGSLSTTAVSYGLYDWNRYHSFTFGLQQRQLPYDKMKVVTATGELVSLEEQYGDGVENWFRFTHDFSISRLNLSTTIGTPLGKVPYSRQDAGLNLRYTLTDRTFWPQPSIKN